MIPRLESAYRVAMATLTLAWWLSTFVLAGADYATGYAITPPPQDVLVVGEVEDVR